MPPEGQNKIEPVLREYAAQRRAAAGPPQELHPANRRVLQGEVARQYPQHTERHPRWRHFMAHVWPRLSFGFSALAILVLLGWTAVTLWNGLPGVGDPNLRTAKNEPAVTLPPAAGDLRVKKTDRDADGFLLSPNGEELLPVKDRAGATVKDSRSELDLLMAKAGEKTAATKSADGLTLVVPTEPGQGAALESLAFTAPAPTPAPGSVAGRLAGPRLGADKIAGDAPVVAGAAKPTGRGFGAGAGGGAAANGSVLGEMFFGKAPDQKEVALGLAPGIPNSQTPNLAVTELRQLALQNGANVDEKQSFGFDTMPKNQTAYFFEAQAESKTDGVPAAQRYAIAPLVNLKAGAKDAPAAAVLSSFEIRRDAGQVRIIDADGSAYEGQVISDASAARPAEGLQKTGLAALPSEIKLKEAVDLKRQAVVVSAPVQGVPQTWYFRATGTNRSLNQPVIINGAVTGGMEEPDDQLRRRKLENRATLGDLAEPAPVPTPAAPPAPATTPSRVAVISPVQFQGNVRVGTGPERELKAIRVPR